MHLFRIHDVLDKNKSGIFAIVRRGQCWTIISDPSEQNSHPKIVFERLGCSIERLTSNTYSYMINPTSGAGADAMDERVGQK
jgi:hypothetical protein